MKDMEIKKKITVIGGPCSLESPELVESFLKRFPDQKIIRGGIFKMRTNKNSYQGPGVYGINFMREIILKHDLRLTTEISDPRQLDVLNDITSIYQVGTRNMYNYELLKELSKTGKTVILKRAMSATIDEWLHAADYLEELGQDKIILCERGIRGIDNKFRNHLDLSSVMYLKMNTRFRVFVDPSHAMGLREYVEVASMAAITSGCDGLLIETHKTPSLALSDSRQAIDYDQYEQLLNNIKRLASFLEAEVET